MGITPSPETAESLQPLSPEVIGVLVAHHRRFHAFLLRHLADPDLAEDVFQDSIRKALERPPSSLQEESVVAWFFHVLRTTLTDHFRSRAARQRKHEGWGREQDAMAPAAVLAELENEICACFRDLLPTLHPSYADVLRRVDLDQEPLEQVAKGLGITLNNAGVRLHRARHALRVSLERTCGTCTTHGCLHCHCSAANPSSHRAA